MDCLAIGCREWQYAEADRSDGECLAAVLSRPTMVRDSASRAHTLILALNPSIDAEWRVNDVLWEEKNNVQSERRWAGGKGINVARWLKHIGGKPRLLLPLG